MRPAPLFAAVALFAFANPLTAAHPLPSGGAFEIGRQRIASGGGYSSGGQIELFGSVAEPATTNSVSVGSALEISSGFLHPASSGIASGSAIFRSGFEE